MARQCIFLIGNIASGKTTLAEALSTKIPSFKIVCIDQCRREIGAQNNSVNDSPYQIEKKAKALFLKKVLKYEKVILPMVGGTRFFEFAFIELGLLHFSKLLIKIKCPPSICYKRFEERQQKNYLPPPLPYRTSDIKKLIIQYAKKIDRIKVNHVLDSSNTSVGKLAKNLFDFLVT